MPLKSYRFASMNFEYSPDGSEAQLGLRDMKYSCLTTETREGVPFLCLHKS